MRESRIVPTIRIGVIGLVLCFGAPAFAAVPQKQALSRYTDLWSKSPFTVPPAVVAPEQVVANPFEDYTLAGVCKLKDGWFVVLINKKQREERIVIKPNAKNEKGFKVVSVANGTSLKETKVEISQGGQTDWVAYDDKFIALRKAAPANGRGLANGRSGMPPIAGGPGAPPIPGRPQQSLPPGVVDGAAAAPAATPVPAPAPAQPGARPSGARPSGARPSGARPSGERPSGERPSGGGPSGGRPSSSRPSGGRGR